MALNLSLCAGIRDRYPDLWQEFSQLARSNQQLSPYWDAIAALDQAHPMLDADGQRMQPEKLTQDLSALSVSSFLPSGFSR